VTNRSGDTNDPTSVDRRTVIVRTLSLEQSVPNTDMSGEDPIQTIRGRSNERSRLVYVGGERSIWLRD